MAELDGPAYQERTAHATRTTAAPGQSGHRRGRYGRTARGRADPAIYARYGTAAYRDVTGTPFGPGVKIGEVRSSYTNPFTKQGPMLIYLRTLGIDGEGAAALPAVKGYDDATGVGSPARYIQSFMLK